MPDAQTARDSSKPMVTGRRSPGPPGSPRAPQHCTHSTSRPEARGREAAQAQGGKFPQPLTHVLPHQAHPAFKETPACTCPAPRPGSPRHRGNWEYLPTQVQSPTGEPAVPSSKRSQTQPPRAQALGGSSDGFLRGARLALAHLSPLFGTSSNTPRKLVRQAHSQPLGPNGSKTLQ